MGELQSPKGSTEGDAPQASMPRSLSDSALQRTNPLRHAGGACIYMSTSQAYGSRPVKLDVPKFGLSNRFSLSFTEAGMPRNKGLKTHSTPDCRYHRNATDWMIRIK